MTTSNTNNTVFQARWAVTPVRAEARHASEQITQLIQGEPCFIFEHQTEWVKITSILDGYQGWVERQMLIETDLTDDFNYWRNKNFVKKTATLDLTTLLTSYALATEEEKPLQTAADAVTTAKSFHKTPYLWGGKHRLGIDCSGFTQLVMRTQDIWLPRDAKDQVLKGEIIHDLREAQTADLIFCTNEKGKVTHVGMLIDNQTVIHASGYVRIDQINENGIQRPDGSYSHNLFAIRRYAKGIYFDVHSSNT